MLAVASQLTGITCKKGATITYDANGNMTSDGTKTYVWDARDRLVQIKTGTTVNASFTYDALGRRSSRTVGSAVTKFLYDGLNPIQEQSASNAATANLLTGLGVDGFISRTTVSDGLTVHFLPDALNSTLALTDSSGAVSTSYTYEPFGKATKTGAATTNTYGFTGREDDGTGLMYYRARYYNPTTQRFISGDPKQLRGGINWYAYVGDSPTRFIDPLGLALTTLGFSFGFDLFGPAAQIGVGVVWNENGQASGYLTGGAGFSPAKADLSGGISFSRTESTSDINDYGGRCVNGSVGGGLGPHGSLDAYTTIPGTYDPEIHPNGISGGGGTIGIGLGGGGSIMPTYTLLTPSFDFTERDYDLSAPEQKLVWHPYPRPCK